MDPQTKKILTYDVNKKSTAVAYLLWFLLGGLGAHRFYLSRTGTAVAILLLSLAGVGLSVVMVGFFVLIVPAIWLLVDLFLIPSMVRQYNNTLIQSLA